MQFRMPAALAALSIFVGAAAAQTAGVAMEERASGAIRLARQVRPAYPPEAKAARLSGKVRLHATINNDGKVKELKIVSGHPLLAAAAYDAVLGWEYEPLEKEGWRVAFRTDIDVNFTLEGEGIEPLDIPGGVQVGKLAHRVTPVYPTDAKQQGTQGKVLLRAVISKTGEVESIYVREGDPALAPAAVEAVKQWRYSPTLVGGQAVPVATDIDINFVLQP